MALPNKITNPIPAEIPKTVPVTHKEINPPTKAIGIVIAAIAVSFTLPKYQNYKRVSISLQIRCNKRYVDVQDRGRIKYLLKTEDIDYEEYSID